ncbi:acyl transferase/acyl hydrolase/lysophospholipase [Peziza echinospora]|nr:acyl transferase/acyl hydrolase/lysophospholipase [Peziza echinospora]
MRQLYLRRVLLGHNSRLLRQTYPRRRKPISAQFNTYSKPRKSIPLHWLKGLFAAGAILLAGGHFAFNPALYSRHDRLQCDSGERSSSFDDYDNSNTEDGDFDTEDELDQRPGGRSEGNPNDDTSAWQTIGSTLTNLGAAKANISLTSIIPEWTLLLPFYFQKLRAELSMAPDSLSYEIWQESLSPYLNPEITWDAQVRMSPNLCDEETRFLERRRRFMKGAFAQYLQIPESEINEQDIPVIAMTASGGGVRAMVSSAGSFWAAKNAGLLDCTTYTAGVSGSCWMQALYLSSIGNTSFPRLIDHFKSRLTVHFAFPPAALSLLDSAPTNRYLLRGVVERAKRGNTSFGLVDLYGLLLSARLLIPGNELAVNDDDLKLSSQTRYLRYGQNPMPIYTCVRHEIPTLLGSGKGNELEKLKEAAAKDWFQWFEITPYEFYSEDLEAGIPTWAVGRRFYNGFNLERDVPEMKLPLLFGIFGSAFCATLNHYYDEIRPFLVGLGWGLQKVDSLIAERRSSLKTVHAFEPASIPNFVKGLGHLLPPTCPRSLHNADIIQLMDAGMSNNLACYPLLRRGRNVDIFIAFDSSAEIQTYNWLGNAEGYAKQRKIIGWPISIGWPKETDTDLERDLSNAQALSKEDAKERLEDAQKADQATEAIKSMQNTNPSKSLGYCTVWVGTKEQKDTNEEPPPSKAVEDEWELMKPDAGITVAYFPLIPNPKVPGVDPDSSAYLSTWNFEWTAQQIEATVSLARANFEEGQDKVQRTVRAVYERKKKLRLEQERRMRESRERDMEGSWKRAESHHSQAGRLFGHGFY